VAERRVYPSRALALRPCSRALLGIANKSCTRTSWLTLRIDAVHRTPPQRMLVSLCRLERNAPDVIALADRSLP
jgi:hypothetical protein